MEFVANQATGAAALPPGVTSIDQARQQSQRPQSRSLSKAVALHLEGKRESAAKMLAKAIEGGERDSALYAALAHIQYEMHDFEAAAGTYSQLAELDPRHRTARFNLGVCLGHLLNWKGAVEAFRIAAAADPTRADALLGLGISLIHAGSPAQALEPLDQYLRLFPDHEHALFGKSVAL